MTNIVSFPYHFLKLLILLHTFRFLHGVANETCKQSFVSSSTTWLSGQVLTTVTRTTPNSQTSSVFYAPARFVAAAVVTHAKTDSKLPANKNSQKRNHFEVLESHQDSTLRQGIALDDQPNTIQLSKSRFSTFFKTRKDRFTASLSHSDNNWNCARKVEQRVVIINLLTWQVGHLIVDILQPLYDVISEAGNYSNDDTNDNDVTAFDTDCILLIQVSNEEEQGVLSELIKRDVYEQDTAFNLLKLYTKHEVRSLSEYSEEVIDGDICFYGGVVVELNVQNSYYSSGYNAFLEGRDSDGAEGKVQKSYGRFRCWLLEAMMKGSPLQPQQQQQQQPLTVSLSPTRVTVIRRLGSRALLNLEEVIEALRWNTKNYIITIIVLEDTPFSKQVQILKQTDLLVAQYGSGAHNLLFMRKDSSIMLITMPNWTNYHWPYSFQSSASSINTIIVGEEKGEEWGWRWGESAWNSGPWREKDGGFRAYIEGVKAGVTAFEDARLSRKQISTSEQREGKVDVFVLVRSENERESTTDTTSSESGVLQRRPRLHVSDMQKKTLFSKSRTELQGSQRLSFVIEVISSRSFWSSSAGE